MKVRAELANHLQECLMIPGEMVEYEKSKQQLTQKKVDTTLYTSWRNNLLFFKDTPLKEVAQIIENNFGYQVKFEQAELAELHFTGSNPANDLKLLLSTLEKSFNLEIIIKEQSIIITHKKRNPHAKNTLSM